MPSSAPAFVVLYRWRLHPGAEPSFIAAWSRLSEILLTRGSLGSRLHRGSDGWWYSYAQWPSAQAREAAFASSPIDPDARQQMRAAVAESLPELILEPVIDLMVPLPRDAP